MNSQIYTYSIVKTLYDRGRDYIDCFWPFIVKVLPTSKEALNVEVIQKAIDEKYLLKIPIYSLKIILTRSRKKGYIQSNKSVYFLTNKGVKYHDKLESEKEVEKRIDAFIKDIENHLISKAYSINKNDIREIIETFINENLIFFEQYLNPEVGTTNLVEGYKKNLQSWEEVIIDYFQYLEKSKSIHYETLREIICGSIISAMLLSRNLSKANQKFSKTLVFFDTNFIFSLLGLHDKIFVRPAIELYELMKSEKKFTFKIFDFTIQEINNVLKGYIAARNQYLPHLRINSIYGNLRLKKWQLSDVREFIANIEERLSRFDIDIEYTGIKIKTYDYDDSRLREAIARRKPKQNINGQNHDLAAIEMIKKLRSKPARTIENATAIFLTSDKELTKHSLIDHNHLYDGTIAEVFLDKVFTNVLWLKNPNQLTKLPISSIIAMHSRHLFIDKGIWSQFCESLKNLREKGDIEDKEIALLLYDQNMQDVLRGFSPENAGAIDEDFIFRNLEQVRLTLDDEKERAIQKRVLDFGKELDKHSEEKFEKWLKSIENIKNQFRNDSIRDAKWLINSAAIMITLILLSAAIFVMPYITSNWDKWEPNIWMCSTLFLLLLYIWGIQSDKFNIRKKLIQKLAEHLYKKRKSKFNLTNNFGEN